MTEEISINAQGSGKTMIIIIVFMAFLSVAVYSFMIYNDLRAGRSLDSDLKEENIIARDLSSLMSEANNLLMAGKEKQALMIYDDLLKRDPKNEQALLEAGIAAIEIKEIDIASERFSQVLKLAGNNPEGTSALRVAAANYYLGKIFSDAGKNDLAIAAFKKSLELDKVNAETLVALADEELKNDKTAEASQHLEMAVKLDPNYLQAYPLLENAYSKTGDQAKTLENRKAYNAAKARLKKTNE